MYNNTLANIFAIKHTLNSWMGSKEVKSVCFVCFLLKVVVLHIKLNSTERERGEEHYASNCSVLTNTLNPW